MADDPTPRWNWRPTTQGNTRPATRFLESLSESDLASVDVRLKLPGSTVADITLTVGDGVTIDDATAGQWDFSIDEMTPETTDGYAAGCYSFEIEVTDDAGTKTPIAKGNWNLIARIPDAP